ncbi:helix-turn-helix domain-containing protein [Amycolatopsis thermalba]|uniref:Helix-turn-helix domain-containing protein n=1 Tax=Amycolatopsis thermalba TaxID=944492 RepID=A0ABY4P2A4_9PSEU|nr:helix-turn-helix domain-containing protein [Amycolatopsis thermalba]UQS26387.1 helix-turn-helix domain-containing protein [Amycolatopsis thermalba]
MAAATGDALNETDTYREWVGSGVVRCWWAQRVPGEFVQRVVPDAAADVIVASTGAAYLVGPTLSPALHRLPPGAELRGLRLRTEAIAAVLGLPGHEVRDAVVPLTAVLPDAAARAVAESVWHGSFPSVLRPRPGDARVRHAVSRIWRGASLDSVAEEVALTGRQLRRLVVQQAGLGPKALQRVARFQRFLRSADAARPTSLADSAAAAGFADQAHLTRETRELAGVTPAVLVRERHGLAAPDPAAAVAVF